MNTMPNVVDSGLVYFTAFKILKQKFTSSEELFIIEYFGERRTLNLPAIATFKILNNSSTEPENHIRIISLNKECFANLYFTRDFKSYREMHFEYFPMGNLHDNLLDNPILYKENLIRFSSDLIDTLFTMHSNQIAHGDLSEKNIYVYKDSHTDAIRFKFCGFQNCLFPLEDSPRKSKGAESYANTLSMQFKSDIKRLGLILLRIVIGLYSDTIYELDTRDLTNYASSMLSKVDTYTPFFYTIMKMLDISAFVSALELKKEVDEYTNPSIILKIDFFQCKRCKNKGLFDRNIEKITLSCKHMYHKKCFIDSVAEQIVKAENLGDIRCEECSETIGSELEECQDSLEPKDQYRYRCLSFKQITAQCIMGHQIDGFFLLNQDLKPYNVMCNNCRDKFCSFCSARKHAFNCDLFKDFTKNANSKR